MKKDKYHQYLTSRAQYPIIILAKGGSKGIPNKNIRPFAGSPLLNWSIWQGLKAQKAGPVYVSSDSAEILSIARKAGAKTITRPSNLAKDDSNSEGGWLHAIRWISKNVGHVPKAIVALQATSPLREPEDIDLAVATFENEGADSLFSACLLEDICLWERKPTGFKALTYNPLCRGRRQDRQPFVLETGSIYVFKSSLIMKSGNRLGKKISTFVMPLWKSWEIDGPDSFEMCESLFLNKLPIPTPPFFVRKPKLIVYDFDGVMTDNRALLTQKGTEAVWVNRSDGWGIQELRKAGIRQVILSTEKNPVVAARARKLNIEFIQGSPDKAKSMRKICCAKGVLRKDVLFVGNDVNDFPAMQQAGYCVAPSNGHPEILKRCEYITKAKGGEGVIREIADLILSGRTQISKRST